MDLISWSQIEQETSEMKFEEFSLKTNVLAFASRSKAKATKAGCSLYPALRDQERALPWCSTRQNRRTERVPYSLQSVEEMPQKSWLSRWTLQRYSRSVSQRPSLSWIETQNWLDRAKVHRDGRVGTPRSHVPSLWRGIQKIPRTVVSHIEKVGQKRADATSTRFSSCSLTQKPSPSRTVKKLQNQYLHSNTGDGILPQAILGRTGTRPKAGGAHDENLKRMKCVQILFFCYSWFRLQLMTIHCNRRGV